MKVINFTRERALPKLLDGTKTFTVRPAFDIRNTKTVEKIPPEFVVTQKARLVWRWHSDSLWYCRICGKRACSQEGKVTGHRDCEDVPPFSKYIGTATIIKIYKIDIDYLECLNFTPSFAIRCNEQHIWTEDEVKETNLHRAPWFNEKYDLKKVGKPFWVYVFKDFLVNEKGG